jgi:hypothetical protein
MGHARLGLKKAGCQGAVSIATGKEKGAGGGGGGQGCVWRE